MFQTIIIAGNLGRDPEMRYTPNGTAVTNFNMATNRKYTGSDGQQVKETTWFRVSVFGKQAEAGGRRRRRGRAEHSLLASKLGPQLGPVGSLSGEGEQSLHRPRPSVRWTG